MIAVQTTSTAMQVHDDLAALLAKNLTLAPVPVPVSAEGGTAGPAAFGGPHVSAASAPTPGHTPASEPAATVAEQPKIVYSISQHYTHSAHVKPAVHPVVQEEQSMQFDQSQQQETQAPQQPQEQQQHPVSLSTQRPFSGPPLSENRTVELLLVRNGIDPTALSPSQIALFKMSALDGREYLLQLWKSSPPAHRIADEDMIGAWGEPASIEKETFQAQMRMQHQQLQQQQQQQRQQELLQQQHQMLQQSQQAAGDVGMSMDSATDSSQPFGQAPDSSWPQSSANTYMEPYMMSGYADFPSRSNYQSSTSPAATMDGVNVPRGMDAYSAFGAASGTAYHPATDPVYNNRLSQTAPTASMAAGNRASWPSQHQSSMEMENQYGALMAMRESGAMEF